MANGRKVIATNRKASHQYFLEDRYEAGLVLTGTEIKSIRAGRANLQQAYVLPRGDELWLIDAHIAAYEHGGRQNHEPRVGHGHDAAGAVGAEVDRRTAQRLPACFLGVGEASWRVLLRAPSYRLSK